MERYDDGTPIVPTLPIWAKEGNKKLHSLTIPFADRNGNLALIEEVTFEDKKGKIHKAVATVKWVV